LEQNSLQVSYENYDINVLEKNSKSIYNKLVKRVIDFILALFLLIVLSPLFLIISICIVVNSGFPIFYKADRGGYQNRPFKIFKFRTMVRDADKIGGGTTALNDPRITRVGKLLRKTKLDEIPQLLNIIKGEMSFIGPRPELLRYTSNYNHIEQYILKVRPGITDYSSVEFINLDEIVGNANADEMYEKYVLQRKNLLRLEYIKKISFLVDCKLFIVTLCRTLQKSFRVIFRGSKNGENIS
jgi:lipopolysaccharide/colanic/teichoic acid biosynthesis glycosyltransferase